jgi:DUF1680 family protein
MRGYNASVSKRRMGERMGRNKNTGNKLSRRQFVVTTLSTAVISAMPANQLVVGDRQEGKPAGPAARNAIANPSWRDQGVEDLNKSPHAKLRNIPIRAVTIKNGFWGDRRAVNAAKSIPSMHDLLETNGRMANFRRLAGKSDAPQRGPVYSDSDIYKWIESVGYVLQSGAVGDLKPAVDKMIDEIVAVQEPDGYLNTYYVGDRKSMRMLEQTQTTGHELYNIGHLLQGAIAYYRGTGDRRLLDAGIRFVDKFLLPAYGPAPKRTIVSGHPEIEMGLIELYRTTGDKNHLDLAGYILRGDDRVKLNERRTIYMFSGTPFTARTKLQGHAVRAMYACCGAADYYLETGDAAYWKTLNVLWEDLTQRQMYISGGVGARSDGEAFGDAYELPNSRAYGESCAAIGNMMWNWRMLAATGESKFTDVIERALYNGINSGMSLDGTLYCYRNPLAFDPSTGDKIRNPWYDTTCCPPNLERVFASLPGYFYSTSEDGIYFHLYDNSELDWHLEDGTGIRVAQKTKYPWDGKVELTVTPSQAHEFTVYLRIPGWCSNAHVAVNGKPVMVASPGRYLPLRRRWSAGDEIKFQMDMPVQLLKANSHVVEDVGRVAVQRGPILYCLEQIDQRDGISLSDVAVDLRKNPSAQFQSETKSDLLGGVVVLHHMGASLEKPSSGEPLYSRYSAEKPKVGQVPLTFIPYYAWANRDSTGMQVWTRAIQA